MIRSQPSVSVRRAKLSDAQAIAEIFRASWRLAYTGIIPTGHLERLIERRDEASWRQALKAGDRVLLLEFAGVTAGYASCGPARSLKRGAGEIYEIYMRPEHQGTGLGAHLFEATRAHLDSLGFRGLVIWALAENQAAKEFYLRRGGKPFATGKERFGSVCANKTAYLFD